MIRLTSPCVDHGIGFRSPWFRKIAFIDNRWQPSVEEQKGIEKIIDAYKVDHAFRPSLIMVSIVVQEKERVDIVRPVGFLTFRAIMRESGDEYWAPRCVQRSNQWFLQLGYLYDVWRQIERPTYKPNRVFGSVTRSKNVWEVGVTDLAFQRYEIAFQLDEEDKGRQMWQLTCGDKIRAAGATNKHYIGELVAKAGAKSFGLQNPAALMIYDACQRLITPVL